jgi:hypothetical protein
MRPSGVTEEGEEARKGEMMGEEGGKESACQRPAECSKAAGARVSAWEWRGRAWTVVDDGTQVGVPGRESLCVYNRTV